MVVGFFLIFYFWGCEVFMMYAKLLVFGFLVFWFFGF